MCWKITLIDQILFISSACAAAFHLQIKVWKMFMLPYFAHMFRVNSVHIEDIRLSHNIASCISFTFRCLHRLMHLIHLLLHPTLSRISFTFQLHPPPLRMWINAFPISMPNIQYYASQCLMEGPCCLTLGGKIRIELREGSSGSWSKCSDYEYNN